MNLESYIRKLSCSSYWQQIYKSSKECSGIHLFENKTNISGLQCLFLYWLQVYNLLYTELAQKSWQVLDIDVINDDDRCDAFLYWRKIEIDKQHNEQKKQERKATRKKGVKDFNIYKGKK